MVDSKTEIMKVFSQLSPDNQRTLLLCARTAKVAEGAVIRKPLARTIEMNRMNNPVIEASGIKVGKTPGFK